MKKIILLTCLLFASWQMQAQVNVIKDIYPGTLGSNPDGYTSYKGATYFAATSPIYGRELWKTDGTSAGTVLVKDIYNGVLSSNPKDFFVANNILYFTANNGTNGNELWMTDGTVTKMVQDFIVGSGSSNAKVVSNFKGNIIMVMDSANNLLYRCCPLGYAQECDPFMGSDSTSTSKISTTNFFTDNSNLYFLGSNNSGDAELYKWDGINAPQLVANINPTGSSNPNHFVLMGDTLFFQADDGSNGKQIWAFDTKSSTLILAGVCSNNTNSNLVPKGSFKNTLIVEDLNNYSNAGLIRVCPRDYCLVSSNSSLKIFNNKLYFPLFDNNTGTELYSWDGINPPTLAIDYNTGTANSNPTDLFVYKDHLFLNATDASGKINMVMYNDNTWGNVKDSISGMVGTLNTHSANTEDFLMINLINELVVINTKDSTGNNYEVGCFAKLQVFQDPNLFEISVLKTIGTVDSVKVETAWDFNSTNTFTAQLSDANGSFNNPKNIGTLSSNKGGKMHIRYPSNIPQSENYRVRVISSSPADTSLPSNHKLTLIPASFINSCNTVSPTIDSIYGGYFITYTYWQIDSAGLPVSSFAPVTVNDTVVIAPDVTNAEMMTIKSLNQTTGIFNITQPKYNVDALAMKVGKKLPVISNNNVYGGHLRPSPTLGMPQPPVYQVTPLDLNPFAFSFLTTNIPDMTVGPIQWPNRGNAIIEPGRGGNTTYAGNRYELQVRSSNRSWYDPTYCKCWTR